MTAVLDRVASIHASSRDGRRPLLFTLRVLPWPLVLAAWIVALRWHDTPMAEITAYAPYWVLTLVLPGTLVFRALRGSRGNWAEDLGLGAITGLELELVAWL